MDFPKVLQGTFYHNTFPSYKQGKGHNQQKRR